jgi:glycosyltransferase involved in cell wall biosynthesis
VTAENRRKLEEMAKSARVLALVPREGSDLAGPQAPAALSRGSYELLPLHVVGRTLPGTRWLFRGAGPHWRRFRPQVALIEQEVWSWAFLQALYWRWRHAPDAVLVIYAWESQRRPGWKGTLARRFYRLASRTARAVLVGNRDARGLFLDAGAEASRVFVMPQVGLDADRLRPLPAESRAALRDRHGVPADAFLVGFAGRLVPEKGVLDLVEAVTRLIAAGRPARLVLIGEGPLRAGLEARATSGEALVVRPPVPREALAPFYQALDVFVLPSRTTPAWKEQFGMVAAEAMACGVPVVGSSSGAIPDLLGSAGIVYAEGDVAQLASALERLASDAALREDLGRRGRDRSARLFSHESLAAQTLVAVRRALGATDERPLEYCDVES